MPSIFKGDSNNSNGLKTAVPKQENSYQANLAQPAQPKKWYAGEIPTTKEMYAQIGRVYQQDKTAAAGFLSNMRTLQSTPGTPYFWPYQSATNPAVSEMRGYGYDVSKVDDDFFSQNIGLRDYYNYSGSTLTPSKPGAKASQQEKEAYGMYQLGLAHEDTKNVDKEWSALQKELTYKAQNPNRNDSDDEIINGIDWSKYPTLKKMNESVKAENGKLVELNRGTDYSPDAMYGVLWAARNQNPTTGGLGTGSTEADTIFAAMGDVGNTWQLDPEIRKKLDPTNEITFSPYTVGPAGETAQDLCLYFGVYSLSQKWVDDNRGMLNSLDETERKNYMKAAEIVQQTQKLDTALNVMNRTIDKLVADDKDADTIIKKIFDQEYTLPRSEVDGYKDLFALDDTMKTGELKDTGWAINYKRSEIENSIRQKCEEKKRAKDRTNSDVHGENAGFVAHRQDNLSANGETMMDHGTPGEQSVASSGAYGADGLQGTENQKQATKSPTYFKDKSTKMLNQYSLELYKNGQRLKDYQRLEDENAQHVKDIVSLDINGNRNNVLSAFGGTEEELDDTLDKFGNPVALNAIHQSWDAGSFKRSYNYHTSGVEVYNNTSLGYQPISSEMAEKAARYVFDIHVFLDNASGLYSEEDKIEAVCDEYLMLLGTLEGDPEKYDIDNYSEDEQRNLYNLIKAEKENTFNDGTESNATNTGYVTGYLELKDEEQRINEEIENNNYWMGYLQDELDNVTRMGKNLGQWIDMYERDGVSKYDPGILNNVSNVYEIANEYTPTQWSSYSIYDLMEKQYNESGGTSGKPRADIIPYASYAAFNNPLAAQQLKDTVAFLEQNGVTFSEEQKNNINRETERLYREARLASYYLLENSGDYDGTVQKAMSDAKDGKLGKTAKWVATGQKIQDVGDFFKAFLDAKANMGYGNFTKDDIYQALTDADKSRYFYILAKDGEDAANNYLADICDPEYGIITTRRSEEKQKEIYDFASQNGWTALLATTGSLLTKVLAGPSEFIYRKVQEANGKEVNPYASAYMWSVITGAAREGSKDGFYNVLTNGIKDMISGATGGEYGDFAKQVAEFATSEGQLREISDFLYDMLISGAADSAINSMITTAGFGIIADMIPYTNAIKQAISYVEGGGLGKVGSGLLKIGSDFLHAAPMGVSAMESAYRDAVLRGASPEQADKLALSTFFAETVSEAITFGNMKEMFAAGQDEAIKTVKDIVIDLAKNAGEEAFGEGFNEFWESNADRIIMGELSEFEKNKQKFIDTGYSDTVAEEMANKLMWKEVLKSALSGALSSTVSGGGSYMMGNVQNTKLGRSVQNRGRVTTETILALGMESDTNSNTYQLAKELNDTARATGERVNNRKLGQLTRGLLNSNNESVQNTVRGLLGYETITPETGTTTQAPQTEQTQEQAVPEWVDMASELSLLLEAQSDTTNSGKAVMNISAVLGGVEMGSGLTPSEAMAAAQTVVTDIAGGDTFVAGQAVQYVLTMSDDANQAKNDIAFAAMTDGVAHSVLEGIVEDIRNNGQADIDTDYVQTLREAVEADTAGEQGPAMQQSFAAAVVQNRIDNRVDDKLSTDEVTKEIAALDEKVDGVKRNADLANDEARSAQETVDVISVNLKAIANGDLETDGDIRRISQNVRNQKKAALKDLEQRKANAERANQILEATQKSVAEEKERIVNRLREEATAEVQQEMMQEIQQQEQEKIQRAAQEIARQQQQAAQDLTDNIRNNETEEIVQEFAGDRSEADQQRVRDKTSEVYADMDREAAAKQANQPVELANENGLSSDEILKRGKLLKQIAKKFGINIASVDSDTMIKMGGHLGNGFYDNKTNTLVLHNNITFGEAMRQILGHELLHITERSGLYKELANTLLRMRYGNDIGNYDDLIRRLDSGEERGTVAADILAKRKTYDEKLGKEHSNEYLLQEIIADQMGTLLDNNGNYEMIERLAADEPSTLRRIVDSIKSFLNKMKGVKDPSVDEIRKTVDMMEKALRQAQWNKQNGQNAIRHSLNEVDGVAVPIATSQNGEVTAEELPGGTVTLDTLGDVRFSLNSFNKDEQARVRDALINAEDENGKKRFTEEQVDRYLEDALGVAKYIADNKQRLDFVASDNQVFLKPNNDYYFTLDASTLCAKRLLYQGTFDYVQHALPDEVFTPDDLIDLVNIMNRMGYETPCGICYVESRRRWLDTYANEFLETVPKDPKSFVDKRFKKSSDEEKAALVERLSGEMPSIDDLTTSDGLERLRNNDPLMHKAFVAAMNAKGTMNPKVVQLRTEYRGDIGALKEKDIQRVKDIGGLRIQSFSDFETPHLLDMMQAVMDMASVGLTSQAYTKVPNFAWVFGDTGIKINLSLIGKGTGLDENGSLVFDNREGIDFDEAMKLRERYGKNVGTILVGINDEHIIAAMGDPRIDFIIPFHKSGWSAEELRKMPTLNNYNDYTDTQNERFIIKRNEDGSYETESFKKHKERTGESLDNFQPVGANKYWNFKESGQWNAENYLKMCAEHHRMPKFWQFLVDNGDGSFSLPQGTDKRSTSIREGYWKTLIDFKMYENDAYGRTRKDGTKTEVKGSEQTEVTPNINMNQAYRVMADYKLGRQMPDNADGTPGKFIEMENNNSVPVAIPAAEEYIETIKRKRAGLKPEGPGPDALEADLPVERMTDRDRERLINQKIDNGENLTAEEEAFMARMNPRYVPKMESPVMDQSAESHEEEFERTQSAAKAIDPETGEAIERKWSMPVKDKKTLDFLNDQERKGEVTRTYRTMKLLDGKLVSPKATYVNGELGEGAKLGEWEMATEDTKGLVRKVGTSKSPKYLPYFDSDGNPIDPDADAYYLLDEKGRKTPARYNPYMHSSNLMLNDQFSGAYEYSGDNKTLGKFVTVECLVPDSEIESGYHAQHAKDPVGWTNWKSGGVAQAAEQQGKEPRRVLLSRWIKPVRIVPDSEVARHYKNHLAGTDIEIPANVVTPSLLNELEKAGVKIGPPSAQTKAKFERTTGRKYSFSVQNAPYFAAIERGDKATQQKIVDEQAKANGWDTEYAVWRGDSEQYNELEPGENGGNLGTGLYFTPDRSYAEKFATKNSPVRKFYLKKGNTFSYDDFAQEFNDYAMNWLEENDMEPTMNVDEYTWSMIWDDFIHENNYDSVSATGVGGLSHGAREIAVQNSWQAKLADPITYDDDGNIIPPTERFNENKEDIRYALPSDDLLKQQIRQYIENQNANPNQPVKEPSGPQRQFGNQTAQRSDELADVAKRYLYEHSDYMPDTNKDQVERAISWIRNGRRYDGDDGYQTAVQRVTSKRFNAQTPDGQARMLATLAMAVAKNDVTAQIAIADAYNREGTAAGQTLQSRKIFRLMTPEGRVTTLRKMLTDEQERLEARGINVDLKFSDYIYQAAAAANKEGEFNRVRKAAAEELGEQLPSNWREKLQSIRMLSMLANPRTHIRNIIGNALFIPAVGLKNKIGALMEIPMSKGQRTKSLALLLSNEIRDFARRDAKFMQDTLTGEAKYNEQTLIAQNKQVFKGAFGWLQKLSDFNSDLLEKEDWIFLKGHYRRALGGWMQANGYTVADMENNTELLEKGRAYAIQEAQKATYRDFNKLASTLNKISREGGAAGFIVDAALPFKKTPANILKRGIEYSPVGIAKSLTYDLYQLHKYNEAIKKGIEPSAKAKSANQVIDDLCSGLSGTAVAAIGFLLSGIGAASLGLGDDDDEFEKLRGAQKYALNPGKAINGLLGAQLLGEDVTYTIDWAAPMSMPFFVGAAIRQQMENNEGFDADKAVDALLSISDPVFNLSMLDGVNSLFKTSQQDDTNSITQIGMKVLTNYATSFVPSFVASVARTADDYRRMSYVKSGEGNGPVGTARYAWEQLENKIPGVSQSNIPYRDVWGNPETSGIGERLIENFLSPGYIQSRKEDIVLDELERVYNETGSSSVIPQMPGKSFKLGAEVTDNPREIKLTDQEWDAYRVARGHTAHEMLTEMMQDEYYLTADLDEQVKLIGAVWEYANIIGKQAVAPDYKPKKDYGNDPVATIVKDRKNATKNNRTESLNKEMIKALDAQDASAFDAVVEALHENGVEDQNIKTKIGNTYRPLYQAAYLSNTEEGDNRMFEIENILDMTGFNFDFKKWCKDADKKEEN